MLPAVTIRKILNSTTTITPLQTTRPVLVSISMETTSMLVFTPAPKVISKLSTDGPLLPIVEDPIKLRVTD
jgi:hypothetical protein